MKSIVLNLLGAFQAKIEGRPIPNFANAKVRALLSYLALESAHPHERARLAARLWPQLSADSALDNLRKSIYRLHQTLEEAAPNTAPLLEVTRHTLHFVAPPATVDVITFQALLSETQKHQHAAVTDCEECVARLTRATELYQGELLAGFELPDAPAFEEWLLFWRERLHQQALEALMTLSGIWEARGNLARANLLVGRVLQMDPYREEAHRQKMRLLQQMGKPEQAWAHYEACKRLLQEDLGVEPEEATTALALQLRPENVRNGNAVDGNAVGGDFVDGKAVPRNAVDGNDAGSNGVGGHPTGEIASPLPALAPELAVATPSPYHPQSYVPEQGRIYGRRYELERLSQWLTQDRCRLVALLGMGGIGKTTLAAAAVRAVADRFEIVLWRSLVNSPPLDEILLDWLKILAGDALAPFPESLDAQLAQLLDRLRQRRCLLVLDNVESIFQPDQAGQLRPERQEYAQLLQRIGELQHQSCLLLTSREHAIPFARLESTLPSVRSLHLDGLDVAAAESMLHDRGLAKPEYPSVSAIGAETSKEVAETNNNIVAKSLVKLYSGNPLALNLVAETILELFGGDIESFLATEAVIFEDIRAVLDWQFDRLSAFEKEILLWLAVEREPLSLQALRDNLLPARPAAELMTALRALRRRSLLDQLDLGDTRETGGTGSHYARSKAEGSQKEIRFVLQNVLLEYLTERLIGIAYQEIDQETLIHLDRHALVKAQSNESVRQSQVRLILRPLADRLQAMMGKEEVTRKLTRILAGLRADPAIAKGYGAGNLLNLLLTLGVDLTGYDFSHLRVWQADLRHATLPGVNLAGADLTHSYFVEGFGYIFAVAYSPDGTLLAAGTSSGDLRLWHVADGRLLHIYQGHNSTVKSVAFSPDGTLLASGGDDETVRLWRVVDKTLTPSDAATPSASALGEAPFQRILPGHKGRVTAVAFHPDGKTLASGGTDQSVRLWDVASGTMTAVLPGHEQWVWALAFHPSGATLASASHDHSIRLWDLQTASERAILRGHRDAVSGIAFAPNGAYLASSSFDGTIRLWDAASGQPLQTLAAMPDEMNAIAISPTGDFLAYGGDDNVVRIWDFRTGSIRHSLSGHDSDILTLAFSPDGQGLATGSSDQTVRLWDAATGQLRQMIIGHSQSIRALAHHPNGNIVASAHYDHAVRLWNLESRTVDQILHGHSKAVQIVAYSDDGSWLASGGDDQTILVWKLFNFVSAPMAETRETNTLRAQRRHTLFSQHGRVTALAFSPDGATLVSGGFGQGICLWEVENGRLIRLLPGHDSPISGAHFSSDGSLLAIVSRSQKIRLWEMHNHTPLHLWQGHEAFIYAVAFSPAQQMLATSGADGVICLWDLRVPTQPVLAATLIGHTDRIFAIAYCADGSRLVSGSADRSVAVWDMQSGQLIRKMHGHTNLIWAVSISPDGTRASSGGPDETVRLWDTQSGECLAVLSSSGPYAGMNISGVTGISPAQKTTLLRLGAVDLG